MPSRREKLTSVSAAPARTTASISTASVESASAESASAVESASPVESTATSVDPAVAARNVDSSEPAVMVSAGSVSVHASMERVDGTVVAARVPRWSPPAHGRNEREET
jgi:hypothetical protein